MDKRLPTRSIKAASTHSVLSKIATSARPSRLVTLPVRAWNPNYALTPDKKQIGLVRSQSNSDVVLIATAHK
jgi:hypothetical protein